MEMPHVIVRLWSYISSVRAWLWKSRPLLWVLVAILMILVLVFAFSFGFLSCEQFIRYSGMVLQLIGVMLIGIGLWDTRRAFEDEPTTCEGIKQWWTGRPPFRPRPVILRAGSAAMGVAGRSARFRVIAGQNASLEQRVAVLEREHAALFDEVGKLTEETNRKISELSNALAGERSEREKTDKGINDQLKKAVAGGLPLGRVGASFFFIGIIAASASPEIASWFCSAGR